MKTNNYQEAQKFGTEASFLANVILTHHRSPARKLKGLVELLRAGHECRTAQFDVDILVIDGKRFGWEVLESPSIVAKWMDHAECV